MKANRYPYEVPESGLRDLERRGDQFVLVAERQAVGWAIHVTTGLMAELYDMEILASA